MKKRTKRIIFVLVGFLVLTLGFLWAYDATYSMDVIEGTTINDPSAKNHVLIASQGSDYKNQVVDEVCGALKNNDTYIKVIDVTTIQEENATDYDAVIILHTWEIWEPQADAAQFIAQQTDLSHFVVHATSGSGDEIIEGVDGISGASVLHDAEAVARQIVERTKAILE